MVGLTGVTVNVAVAEPDLKLSDTACVAVMVADPTPTMVTVLPEIVATLASLLV